MKFETLSVKNPNCRFKKEAEKINELMEGFPGETEPRFIEDERKKINLRDLRRLVAQNAR